VSAAAAAAAAGVVHFLLHSWNRILFNAFHARNVQRVFHLLQIIDILQYL